MSNCESPRLPTNPVGLPKHPRQTAGPTPPHPSLDLWRKLTSPPVMARSPTRRAFWIHARWENTSRPSSKTAPALRNAGHKNPTPPHFSFSAFSQDPLAVKVDRSVWIPGHWVQLPVMGPKERRTPFRRAHEPPMSRGKPPSLACHGPGRFGDRRSCFQLTSFCYALFEFGYPRNAFLTLTPGWRT